MAIVIATIIVTGVTAPSLSQAQEEGGEENSPHSVSMRNVLIGRLNPQGLIEQFLLSYYLRLYESDSPVLENNYVGIGVTPWVSPSFIKPGLIVEVQPMSILRLYGAVDWIQYFGNLAYLQSFPSADDAYDDTTLGELSDEGLNYSALGTQITLGALLQLKLGPVAMRTNFRAIYSDFDTRDDEPVVYDIINDTLLRDDDWTFVNDADLLVVTDFGLIVGVRHNYTQVDYTDADFAGTTSTEDQRTRTTHRLGPLIAYEFYDLEEPSLFDKPTLFTLINWYLDHPWRTGEDVSQAIPYFAIGFAFTGDLL